MAKTPAKFPSETGLGKACGHTWAQNLVVTGRLPNGFGAQLQHELTPVISGDLSELGWNGDEEARLLEQLQDRIKSVFVQTNLAKPALSKKNLDAIRWLLRQAEVLLVAVSKVHQLWWNRKGGAWTLDKEDRVTNFLDAHPDPCAGNMGEWKVDTSGARLRNVRCPSEEEIAQRPKDRATIRQLVEDAAMHVRCAEFGLWRSLLYQDALDAWKETPQGGQAGGFQTRPGEPPRGPDGLQATPWDRDDLDLAPTPPSEPPDVNLPDPGVLPTPKPPPPPPGTGPDGVTGGKRTYASRSASRGPVIGRAVLAIGGIALAVKYLPKALR